MTATVTTKLTRWTKTQAWYWLKWRRSLCQFCRPRTRAYVYITVKCHHGFKHRFFACKDHHDLMITRVQMLVKAEGDL